MTAQEVRPPDSIRPATPTVRPQFSFGRLAGWALYPLINRWLGPKRRDDGSFPGWVMKLPNQLTKSRRWFPLYGALFVLGALNQWVAVAVIGWVVILLAYLTDAFDGEIARYAGATSEWGERWDPYLDKWAGVSMFACWFIILRAFAPALMLWFVVLATTRILEDATLAIIAKLELNRGLRPRAKLWGKLKSGFDVVGVLLACFGGILYAGEASGSLFMQAGALSLGAAALFGPLSIYEHFINWWRARKR